MARNRRKGGRTTPKGTRPGQERPWAWGDEPEPVRPIPPGEHPFRTVIDALGSDHPIDLLVACSSMARILQPDGTPPFAAPAEPNEVLDAAELVTTLTGVREDVGATGLLAGLALMLDDPDLRRVCQDELAQRRHVLPEWFARLGEAEVTRAMKMDDLLGDGGNLHLEVRWPTGHVMTIAFYLDNHMGGLVKDALVADESAETVEELFNSQIDHPDDVSFAELDLAQARAIVENAVRIHEMTWPPVESDSWPMSKPLLGWLLRLMPEGGEAPERREWTSEEEAELADAFLASPYAAAIDPDDAHHVEALLWYGTGYGSCDPFRWSPVRVQLLLEDWAPRKIMAPVEDLVALPSVLRAFVRWAHDQVGIRPELTDETLAAISESADAYRHAITDDGRPQGPAAMLAEMGLDLGDLVDPADVDLADVDPADIDLGDFEAEFQRMRLDGLLAAVGSEEALVALDTHPLPDEPQAVDHLPADIVERVARTGELADQAIEATFGDVELRTAARRFLADVAAGDPEIFRRASKDETAAAAVAWTVAKANNALQHGKAGELLASIGVKGSVSQRANPMLAAIGASDSDLGDVRYLTSTYRARLIELRDLFG